MGQAGEDWANDGLAGDPSLVGTDDDPLVEAYRLVSGAQAAGVAIKLLGGLAVRLLCPDFPPRLRRDQDIDLACLSKGRKDVSAHLESVGCEPDRRFNNLNGDRQMYFTAPSGRPIDVMVDRLSMCHELDFRPSFGALPHTLDVVDLLLSKLQIVELNPKDARDIFHLLARFPVRGEEPAGGWLIPPDASHPAPAAAGPGATAGLPAATAGLTGGGSPTIDKARFEKVLGADWGWWRTVTGNLEKLPALSAQHPGFTPGNARIDPLANAARLLEIARAAPKSLQWKVRSKVGDKMRWYELPEEVAH